VHLKKETPMSGITQLVELLSPYLPLVVVILLLLILVVAVVALHRMRSQSVNLAMDTGAIDDAIERLQHSVAHVVDVSAVVELIAQLDANPDAIELLKDYPEKVRAAAWLHYINKLGSDLQHAQNILSSAHRGEINYGYERSKHISNAQRHVDEVRAKLDAAITASGQPRLHKVS